MQSGRWMRAQITTLIIATSLVQLANGFFGTFISLRVAIEDFGSTMAGLVLSSYFVGFTLAALRCGRIIERIGHIRSYAAFAGLVAPQLRQWHSWPDHSLGWSCAQLSGSVAPDCSLLPRVGLMPKRAGSCSGSRWRGNCVFRSRAHLRRQVRVMPPLSTPAPPARLSSQQALRWRKQDSQPSVPAKAPSLLRAPFL